MTVARWSHSLLSTMLDGCSWQVYLERFVGLDSGQDHARAASGTAHHAGIELHEQRRRWGQPTSFDELVAASLAELDTIDVDWTVHDRDAANGEVERAAERWWSAPIGDGQPGAGGSMRDRVLAWQPVAVERPGTIWQADYSSRPFKFIADGVYLESDGSYVIVDQKTAGDFKRYGHDGGKQLPQASAYMLGCRLAARIPVPSRAALRVEFHITRVAPLKRKDAELVRVLTVRPSPDDVEQVRRRMLLADRRVAAGEFYKVPSWNLCSPKWCPHHVDAGGTCTPDGDNEFPIDVVGEPLPVLA